MSQALENVKDCRILRGNPKLTAKIGEYSYQIRREGDQSIYTVTNGKETFRVAIQWAFGQGSAGQTYMFEHEGQWFESRVSYYSALDGLDLTMGAASTVPANLEQAAGRLTHPTETFQCFNCHATNLVKGHAFSTEGMVPGVQCERCHGSSDRHVKAVRTGDLPGAAMHRLGAMTSEEVSDFCGQCHRTWSQIATGGPRGILNVRFQPYRLTNSKCYDGDDARIRCVSCHNPHENYSTVAASYDAKCQACHSANASPVTKAATHLCPVATKDCVTCHMPKLELPGAHKKFTDHTIRIVHAGEKYPG